MLDRFIENIPTMLLLCVLVAASGTVSASETALFALTRKQLQDLAALRRVGARLVAQLRADPRGLLATILLTNTAINVFLYSVLGVASVRIAGNSALWATAIGTGGFVLTVFGAEILPKQLALTRSASLAMLVAPVLRALVIGTAPIRWLLENLFVEPLTRLLSGTRESGPTITGEELQELVNISQNEGLIDDRENRIIHQVVELAETRVSALMVPRVDFIAFNLAGDRRDLARLFRSSRLLRIPVYEGTIDNITGYVTARDFFLNPEKMLRDLVQHVQFIPEQAGVEALLQHFRRTGTQMAIVVDEYGGLAGVVSLEDVVEAIVGNLSTPDEPGGGPGLLKIDDKTYIVDGGMDVDDFRRAFELPLDETRIDTVGGLIVEALDRLPEPGDEVTIEHVALRVQVMRKRRVFRAIVTLKESIAENADLALLLCDPAALHQSSTPGRKRS